MGHELLIIFIIIAGAAVIPFLARMLHIPAAACEILFGVLLFNTIISHTPEWFSLLSELGFIYLMFIAGMESDLEVLLQQPRNLVWYTLIVVVSLVVTPLLFVAMGYPFYIGIALAVVSEAILVAVLKETGIGKKPIGRHIIGIALTGEILSIALLTGIDIYHKFGFSPVALLQVVKLVVLLFIAALFLKLLYVTAWWNPRWVQKVMASDDPVEEGIRVIIAVAFAGALLAHFAGVEAILGSFMAGIVFGYVFKSKGRFEDKINAVGFGFFTPFFFISVGAKIDIVQMATVQNILFALFLTFMVFISNCYPLLLFRFLRITFRESLSISLILSAPLTMIIVAGTLGQKMGFIDAGTKSILILTALISSIVYPFLFRLTSKSLK